MSATLPTVTPSAEEAAKLPIHRLVIADFRRQVEESIRQIDENTKKFSEQLERLRMGHTQAIGQLHLLTKLEEQLNLLEPAAQPSNVPPANADAGNTAE